MDRCVLSILIQTQRTFSGKFDFAKKIVSDTAQFTRFLHIPQLPMKSSFAKCRCLCVVTSIVEAAGLLGSRARDVSRIRCLDFGEHLVDCSVASQPFLHDSCRCGFESREARTEPHGPASCDRVDSGIRFDHLHFTRGGQQGQLLGCSSCRGFTLAQSGTREDEYVGLRRRFDGVQLVSWLDTANHGVA